MSTSTSSSSALPPVLWSRRVRKLVIVGHAVGVALGAIGVLGAAAQNDLNRQIAWINLTVIAALIAGCSQAMWLLEGRRSVSLVRRRAVARFVERQRRSTSDGARPTRDDAVVVPGGRAYHRPDCLLVHGKPTVPFHGDEPRPPCAVCIE